MGDGLETLQWLRQQGSSFCSAARMLFGWVARQGVTWPCYSGPLCLGRLDLLCDVAGGHGPFCSRRTSSSHLFLVASRLCGDQAAQAARRQDVLQSQAPAKKLFILLKTSCPPALAQR